MNTFLIFMCVVFFNKIFSADDGDFQYVSIDEAQAPSEQQFKATYGVLIGEDLESKSHASLLQQLHFLCEKPIDISCIHTISILLQGIGEHYVTQTEQQQIALHFLNRKKVDSDEYFLTEKQRQQLAAVIMKRLISPSVHISRKILNAMLILETEILLKNKDEYIFKTQNEGEKTAIILNCQPRLVSKEDLAQMVGSLMEYIFIEPLTKSERYARYMYCHMYRYTGIHFGPHQEK